MARPQCNFLDLHDHPIRFHAAAWRVHARARAPEFAAQAVPNARCVVHMPVLCPRFCARPNPRWQRLLRVPGVCVCVCVCVCYSSSCLCASCPYAPGPMPAAAAPGSRYCCSAPLPTARATWQGLRLRTQRRRCRHAAAAGARPADGAGAAAAMRPGRSSAQMRCLTWLARLEQRPAVAASLVPATSARGGISGRMLLQWARETHNNAARDASNTTVHRNRQPSSWRQQPSGWQGTLRCPASSATHCSALLCW
jgi:hypothetical protein